MEKNLDHNRYRNGRIDVVWNNMNWLMTIVETLFRQGFRLQLLILEYKPMKCNGYIIRRRLMDNHSSERIGMLLPSILNDGIERGQCQVLINQLHQEPLVIGHAVDIQKLHFVRDPVRLSPLVRHFNVLRPFPRLKL